MNGDVLRRLAEGRPEHLDPEALVDDETRTRELAQAMSAPRTTVKVRRVLRPMWGLGLVGAAAAAALVVATTATSPGDGGKGDGGKAAVPSPARSLVKLNARSVLLTAAESAKRQPISHGKYWHSQVQFAALEQVGPANNQYAVLNRYQHDNWDPASPKVEGWFKSSSLGTRPATPADEAAWRRDGSPSAWSTQPKPAMKGAPPKRFELKADPKDESFAHSTGKAGDAPDALNVTNRELEHAGANPARLRALILSHPLGEAYDGHNSDIELFEESANFLLYRPLKPGIRSALYRMLAEIKGVSAVDGVQDPAGRTGTALRMRRNGPDGLSEIHFIVDRATGAGLAKEIHYLKGKDDKAWLKPGDRWYSETVTSEWVNTLPPMPRAPRGG